jgi:hypothetical protein
MFSKKKTLSTDLLPELLVKDQEYKKLRNKAFTSFKQKHENQSLWQWILSPRSLALNTALATCFVVVVFVQTGLGNQSVQQSSYLENKGAQNSAQANSIPNSKNNENQVDSLDDKMAANSENGEKVANPNPKPAINGQSNQSNTIVHNEEPIQSASMSNYHSYDNPSYGAAFIKLIPVFALSFVFIFVLNILTFHIRQVFLVNKSISDVKERVKLQLWLMNTIIVILLLELAIGTVLFNMIVSG